MSTEPPVPALPARFAALWTRLSAKGDPTLVAHELLARWSEPHRHYHTLAHLTACLAALDAYNLLAADSVALETALWFHDAIYDPRATDNEARSAARAVAVLRSARVSASTIEKTERLILATRAHQADSDPDTALLLDIDLAVLGADPDVYQSYARAIRREYAWVPEADYRAKRAAVLSRFLQRPRLFLTPPFYARHEAAARENMSGELRVLSRHPEVPPCP